MKRVSFYVIAAGLVAAVCGWGILQSAEMDDVAKSGTPATNPPAQSGPQISSATIQKKKPNTGIPEPTVVLKPGENPKPEAETLVHDFGDVPAGTVAQFDFKIKNVGTGPLEILTVRPGCGCTTSGDYDKIIQPGGTGTVPIKLSTAKFQGEMTKSISVFTNASGVDSLVMLTMKGSVRPLYVVEPTKLEFGAVEWSNINGKTLTNSVTVTNKVEQPLVLTNLRSSNANFKAGMKELEAGKKYEITVEFGGTIRTGSNGSAIEVDTNFPDIPQIRIPTAVFVNAPLEIMPSQLVLSTNRKVPFTRAFFIQNNTQKSESVSELRVSDPKLKARLEETTPGVAWKVMLEVPVDYEGSAGGDTLSLKTSNPEIPELIVDIITRELTPPGGTTTKPVKNADANEHAGHEH
ncbi:MAG: DUF1573 domain-containing protein [Planctomycetes bacterium]|nr:DUF1573 domain-containing protein [Planctomycetota bacterium]